MSRTLLKWNQNLNELAHVWNTLRIKAPWTYPVIVMNQKGPPGLGLQTGSMLTFWSIIKGEMMRGDFVFYTMPTLLFKKKPGVKLSRKRNNNLTLCWKRIITVRIIFARNIDNWEIEITGTIFVKYRLVNLTTDHPLYLPPPTSGYHSQQCFHLSFVHVATILLFNSTKQDELMCIQPFFLIKQNKKFYITDSLRKPQDKSWFQIFDLNTQLNYSCFQYHNNFYTC